MSACAAAVRFDLEIEKVPPKGLAARPTGPGATILALAARGAATLQSLRGVPRPVLQTVFGRELGHQLWERSRKSLATAPSSTSGERALPLPAMAFEDAAGDSKLLGGLLDHASRDVEAELRWEGRKASSIRVTLCYADDIAVEEVRQLPVATDNVNLISSCAGQMARQMPPRAIALQSVSVGVSFA